jgi:drug/metabolite transporter (DMT)-like permease
MPKLNISSYRFKLIFNLFALYIIWGSTYLASKIAIYTMPPLMMGGVRFLVGGGLLLAFGIWKTKEKITLLHWRNMTIVGFLLFLIGNGAVLIAFEMGMDSGIAALIIAIMPLWMVGMDQLRKTRTKPGLYTIIGLIIGIAGLVILLDPFGTSSHINIAAALVVLTGTLAWATGSTLIRVLEAPKSGRLAAGMQMLTGGIFLILFAFLRGEHTSIAFDKFSLESILAFLYLIVFGSLIAINSYNWLLKNTSPAMSGTYAYVNPVIAMILGAVMAGEVVTLFDIGAASVILTGVVLISLDKNRKK